MFKMEWKNLLTIIGGVLILLCLRADAAFPIVDVALNKPISANLTCGTYGPEKFFSHKFIGSATPANEQICQNAFSYPASAMVNGNENIWWQSTSRISFVTHSYGTSKSVPDAVILVNLSQVISTI